jgi:translation initiation factor 3 subunit D
LFVFIFPGEKLFFDKRDNTEFDLLTVNETSIEPPIDDGSSLNSPRNLAIEATFINHNFSQQVLKLGPTEPKFKFDEPNPFIGDDEEAEIASVAYRYRKWNLSNGIVSIFSNGNPKKRFLISFVFTIFSKTFKTTVKSDTGL